MGTVMGRMCLMRLWEGCQHRSAWELAMHSFGCWLELGRELERVFGSVLAPGRVVTEDLAGGGTLWEEKRRLLAH